MADRGPHPDRRVVMCGPRKLSNLHYRANMSVTDGRTDDSTGSSEESGEREAGRGAYRVRVNMERLFGDERARVLVCVSARRRVRWLERRLRAQFPLPPRVALLSAGHLLPPAEPLAVLAPDDVVDVLPAGPRDPDPAAPAALQRSKRRALAHLDRLCEAPARETPALEGPARDERRKRRRVRRRRRDAAEPDGELQGAGGAGGAGSAGGVHCNSPPRALGGGLLPRVVLRLTREESSRSPNLADVVAPRSTPAC